MITQELICFVIEGPLGHITTDPKSIRQLAYNNKNIKNCQNDGKMPLKMKKLYYSTE